MSQHHPPRNTEYKLSPSDFAFLYEECKLCYWLKVKHGINTPQLPFPGVFSTINTKLQTPLVGKNLNSLSESFSDAVVESQEGFVESHKIPDTNVFIKGKYDLLAKKPDGTYILIDLKISKPEDDKVDKYQTQLGAYKYALEHPVQENPIKITEHALLVFYPDTAKFDGNTVSIDFPPIWMDVPLDDKGFLAFIKDIDALLSGRAPSEDPNCKWCAYRHEGERIAHLRK